MIDRFYPNHCLHHLWIMLMDMLDQLGLGVGGSGNQKCARSCYRFHDGLKVVLIILRMSTPDRVGFMVDVLGWMVWMQHRSIDIRRAQMENSGFAVINPNDGMIMRTVHRIDLFHWRPQWRLGLRKAFDGPVDINFDYGSSVEGAQALQRLYRSTGRLN